MKEKILMALVCISLLSGFVYATSVYEKTCPYDDDFKHALRKALIDYLKDPSKSKLTLDEIKDMLSFYLSKPTIMDADCSQGDMNPLVDKADNQIPDGILDIFKSRKIDKKCVGCSDGTVCGEKNVKDQTCRCKDIDNDGEYEFCHLNPLRPTPTRPTCDSCPDGTDCKEKNQQGQTCECKDINSDGGYEYCYLRPLIPPTPPYPACNSCPDGTVCGEMNQQGQTCKCKDINSDGTYEYCYLKPPMPPYPTCDSCPDGTVCGEMNQQGQTCECKDINGDGNYERCYLRPLPIVCHKHTNPAWLTANDYDIKVLKRGCTSSAYGTEYLIEMREGSHCGEQMWIWLEPGAGPLDINNCYRAYISTATTFRYYIASYNGIVCPNCPSTEEQLTVTSPNGGEIWQIEDTYDITWSLEPKVGVNDKVAIYLVDGSQEGPCTLNGVCCYTCGNWKSIASGVSASSGKYSWKIPSNQKTGSKYKIFIRTISSDCFTGCVDDMSDNHFSIIAGKLTCTDSDGGRDYYKKGTVTLQQTLPTGKVELLEQQTDYCAPCYRNVDSPLYVKEYYCEGNEIKSEAAFDCPDGCPNGCQDGACVKGKEPYCSAIGSKSEGWYQNGLIKWDNCDGCYAVCKLVGTDSEGWYSSCDNKLIKYEECGGGQEPFITVTSPNGGEQWMKGNAYDITWSPGPKISVNDKVAIYLVDESQNGACTENGACCYTCSNWKLIASGVPASFGKYGWNIPANQKVDTKYKIFIRTISSNCFTGCVDDMSDNYFSIIGEGTQTCTDTDGGRDYYKRGGVSKCYSNTCTTPTPDFCIQFDMPSNPTYSGKAVKEYYCDGNEIKSETFECPNGCQDGACMKGEEPYCSAIGSKSEGWYQNGLIKWDNCDGCYAICKLVGTDSEGWYSSCDGKLIKYDDCEISCRDENYPCTIEDIPCCSGLQPVPLAEVDSEGNCVAANCGSICRPCGNGKCDTNENKCNCPADCK